MKPPLRVLLVEDSDEDAELVTRELKRAFDLTFVRVQTADDLAAALAKESFDIVISDYSMPRFSGPEAYATFRASGIDIPFIIASGTIGEEVAVTTMKLGVADYILKDKLTRLVPAIERELREAESRRARRKAEDELHASEARFRDLFETAPDAILGVDADGKIVLANATAKSMFGFDPLVGQSIESLVPVDARADHAKHRARYGAKPSRRRTGLGRILEGVRKNGTRFPVEVSLGPSVVDGQEIVLAVVRDVTDRVELEQRLLQSQKLEAIGSLAAGVAHDFNNLLSVVLSYSSLVLGALVASDPMRADIQEIHAAAVRASDLTRQLLAFGRKQILKPQPTNLGAVVTAMDKMLRRLLGEDVELAVLPAADLGTTIVDPGQIEQIVMNLVVNARDAMPTGGKLTIETSNVELDESYATRHAVPAGPYVMLAVSDTGEGMDSATRERAFEPFFTTKERGKGTGLGLSTVFGIVKQSGGHIWLYSEPGKGTTFKLYFPRAVGTEAEASSPPPPPTRRGNETILLVEDDDALRAVAATILRRQGYHVLDARSGGDALMICEQHGATIHLLLTDVVMPRMSGRQVAERLQPLRPGMKVLYMSGYTDNSIVHHGVLDSGVAFLQKPITPDTLVRKVREVLDS